MFLSNLNTSYLVLVDIFCIHIPSKKNSSHSYTWKVEHFTCYTSVQEQVKYNEDTEILIL